MWLPLRYVFNLYWYWTLFLHWLNLELMGIPFKFHLESFWNLGGISMEFPWNSTGNPWESTGMAHSYHSCRFPVEFQHSMGFWQNLPELMEEGKVLMKTDNKKGGSHKAGDLLFCIHAVGIIEMDWRQNFWIRDTTPVTFWNICKND